MQNTHFYLLWYDVCLMSSDKVIIQQPKKITMKKILLIFIPVLFTVFLFSSCKKDDPGTPPSASPVGTWNGNGQYGTGAGNPQYTFTLTFKANGSVDIVGNNSTAIDNATGTWQMVQDSVKATYKYLSSSAQYTLSAKYNATSNVMVGTIGLSPATSGVGVFSVTKQ